MKGLLKVLIPAGLLIAMSGCVVAPYGYYHRPYYGGPAVVVRPAYVPPPVVVVRP